MRKKELETFKKPSSYDLHGLKQDEPSVFSGIVSVKKYRITIELVEESDEVIKARILKLWNELKDKGSHRSNANALQAVAAEYNIVLK